MRKFYFALLVILIPSICFGADHYIRKGGGSGSGTSWSDTWDDFGSITGLSSGDVIYIATGTYTGQMTITTNNISVYRATVASHGTDTGWSAGYDGTVTIQTASSPSIQISGVSGFLIDGDSDGDDESTFVLDGQSTVGDGIDILSSSDITIRCLTIKLFTNHGIDTTSSTAPAVFDDLEITRNGHGSDESANCGLMLAGINGSNWSTNFTEVKNSYIHDADYYSSGLQDTDLICGTNYMSIHDNYIAESRGVGDSSDSISIRSSNVKISSNVFYRGDISNQCLFLAASMRTVENIDIYNNLVYKAAGTDSAIEEWINITDGKDANCSSVAPGCYPVRNVNIVNNTVVGPFDYAIKGSDYWDTGSICGASSNEACAANIVVKNNIFATTGDDYQGPLGIFLLTNNIGAFTLDNNFYKFTSGADILRIVSTNYTLAEIQSSLSQETNGVASTSTNFDAASPSFTDHVWTSGLKLTAASTLLIGAGADMSSLLTDDYFDNSRGTSFDIGAHQYNTPSITTYYIDPDWTGVESGTVAEPYNSVGDLPTLEESDKVYFKAGTTYNSWASWRLTAGGTAENNAVVGSYYVSGGTAYYDYAGIISNGGRAILDGGWDLTLGSSTCSSNYDGAIEVAGAYTTIENLDIRNFKGRGIFTDAVEHVTVQHNTLNHLFRNAISFVASGGVQADYGTASYNTVNDASKISIGDLGASLSPSCWPATIAVIRSEYGQIDHNTITNSFGEGIGVYNNSSSTSYSSGYCTIENNIMVGNWAAGVYIQGSVYNVIRNNQVYGTTDTDYVRYDSTYTGHAYMDANESLGGGINLSHHNYFYNNIGAFTYGCLAFGGNDTVGNIHDDFFWNNTCISNRYGITALANGSTNNHYNIEAKNNIIFCISGDTCSETGLLKTSFFSDIDYNYWSADPGSYLGSNSFISSTVPVAKTSSWQSMNSADYPSESDFTLVTSDAVGGGADLGGAPYNISYNLVNRDNNPLWDIGAWALAASNEVSTSNRCLAGTQNRAGAGTVNRAGAAVGVVPTCSTSNDQQIFPFSATGPSITSTDDTWNIRGQTFLSSGETSTGFGLYCVDNSSDVGSQTCELKRWDTVNLEPMGSVLAVATVASSALPNTAGDYFFGWSSPYTTTSGLKYVAYCKGISGGSMTIYRQSAGSVANSENVYSYDFGTTWGVIDYDLRGQGEYGCYE